MISINLRKACNPAGRIGATGTGFIMIKQRLKRLVLPSIALSGILFVTGIAAAPAASAAVVIGVCTIKANDPHPSTHVNGTINGTGTVSCSVTMDEIYLKVKLERSTGTVVDGTTDDYFNTAYESGNASTSCANAGTWRTRVEYALRAPAGYSPAYSANNFASPWKAVACGAARVAPDSAVLGDDSGYYEETFEVTVPASVLK
jgi:hypothetical protein